MGCLSNATKPFMFFPVLLLLCLSTFTGQHLPSISISTTTSSHSSSFLLIQENITSSSNSTQTDDFSTPTHAPRSREKTSLDRIEYGLAKARAAILKAVRTRNYTSDREEDFIPRGLIYRNQYAFHQSHIEMEKRFRVWSYKEGEPPLVHNGPLNREYSTEGHFIDEMESGINPLMAKHPEEAYAFYLPFSVTNVLRFVYDPKPNRSFLRDKLQLVVEDYIRVISDKYPYWNRSSGADHFLAACHDWGPGISGGNPELFRHFIRVLCNANTSEGFQANRDVSLPEINIPFGLLERPTRGKPVSKRTILAFFAGRAHGKIRKVLFKHWKEKDNEVLVYESLPKGRNYAELMGRSKYCLCPSGWEVASPRVVEAIQSGCVPVLLSQAYVAPFSDVLDYSKFSVQIGVEKIQDIKTILKGIPNEEFLRMQKRLRSVQKHFEMNRPAKRFDVMYMVLHSVWLRRLNFQLPT